MRRVSYQSNETAFIDFPPAFQKSSDCPVKDPSTDNLVVELTADLMIGRVDICVAQAQPVDPNGPTSIAAKIRRYVELLIIDETERLSAITLEYVRANF